MIETTKYVRRPLFVDAVQVTVENFRGIAEWCQGNILPIDDNYAFSEQELEDVNKLYIHVRVHKPAHVGQTRAVVGDWILYTDLGYKVYKTRAFLRDFILYDPKDWPQQDNTAADAAIAARDELEEDAPCL